MRPIKPNTRRRSLWRTVLLALVAIVLGGAGTVAALAGLKVIDLTKLWATKPDHPAGWIGIPLSAQSIPAYTEVTRDYLLNAKTGALVLKWVPPDAIPKGVIADLSKILKRVTARDKPAVYYFFDSDFLPEGTRPGISGGTPQGKRAITLDAGKLKGVHELQEGDHVDLLASVAVDMPGAGRSNSGRSGTNVMTTPDALLLPKRGFVRPLVEDGVVITPVKTRNVPTTVSSLTQGATPRSMPVQEIVLAVAPEEVRLLAEAMDLKYEITCVARSGRPAPGAQSPPIPAAGIPADRPGASSPQRPVQPGEAVREPAKGAILETDRNAKPARSAAAAKADMTPGLDPMADVRYLEVMIGTQRQFVLFNGPGNSPVIAGQSDESAKAGAGSTPAATPGEDGNPKSE